MRLPVLWGRHARSGLIWIAAVLVIDQLHKWWMLGPVDIAAKGRIEVWPFLDLVMVWNTGVSYGLFATSGNTGRYVLISLSLVVCVFLWFWLVTANRRLQAIGLAMVIGGALGNVIDRIIHGAVADFFLLHAFGYSWYVFNLADTAIVAGVIILVYCSFQETPASTADNA